MIPNRLTPMTVAAFLPPMLLRHLQFVLGKERPVIVAESWKHMAELLQTHPVSVAVIDPAAQGAGNTLEFQRLVSAYPSLPVLAYMTLSPAAFHAVAELSKVGLEHAILYGQDDAPDRLIAALDRVRASPLTTRMLRELRPRLDRLPVALAKAVEEMFEEPHRYLRARDMAIRANLPAVRLYRSFKAAGLVPPKKLLIAANLLRAYTYLSDPGHSVRGVAKKLGYRNPRIFARNAFDVFGLKPSWLPSHLSADQVLARLAIWVVAGTRKSRGKQLGRTSIPRKDSMRGR